ncbi:MAG: histidine kinase [Fibrobacteria bacterium]|jgi:signal transduction protein with GAF and PtsI domain|nr:histidine kinase [Fibrobacteria bacterium]
MTPTLQEDIRKVLDRQGTSDLAFDSIVSRLMTVFDAEAAVVYTLDPATGMLKLRCHDGLPRNISDRLRFLCIGKGLPGKAAVMRQPIQSIHDPESACAEELEALPPGSLFVPMLSDNCLRGVLGVAKNFHREYAPDEVAALTAVAALIAAYLK